MLFSTGSHNIPLFFPLLSHLSLVLSHISLSLSFRSFTTFLPLLLSLFFLLSASVLDVVKTPSGTSHWPGTEESGFLSFVQYELGISQRAGGDTEGQTTLKSVLSQEHVMTLIQELTSSPQTRVSDGNSVPHFLPIPQSPAWP